MRASKHDLTTTVWWHATLVRAIRTAAQAAVAAIGAAEVFGDVAWPVVVGTVALATILSVLTAIASTPPEVQTR